MDPIPPDMSPYYKGGYDPIPKDVAGLQAISFAEQYRTNPLLKRTTKGRFLEIGPWRGVICHNMKAAGFDVTAIEMDPKCVAFLREHLEVEAIQSTNPAETMKDLEPGFTAIAAWHSLEHLPTPWSVIEQASRLLAPGGVLLLAMPNPKSFEFSILGPSWMHLDAPRHLYLYSLESLVRLCAQNNLEVIEATTADKFSSIQSRHAWQTWARSWIPIRYLRGIIGMTLGRMLFWGAYRKQMTEGLGSAYTAMFVRR